MGQIYIPALNWALMPIEDFLREVAKNPPVRVPGTAIFMNGTATGTPPALEHNLEHNKVLHKRVVLLAVKTNQVPHVDPQDRVKVEALGHEFYRLIINYGFMEDPDIPKALETLELSIPTIGQEDTTYFLGRETVIASKHPA